MLFYLMGWVKTPVFTAGNQQLNTKVSIILPVRNEAKNIRKILECLSKQIYPKEQYEIIVVDDFSSDNTLALAGQTGLSNLKIVRLALGEGKKKAITEGIFHSTGTLIVTTDADCEMGEGWLGEIVAFYEEKKPKIISAPVLVKGEKNFLEIMQAQEMSVLTACGCASIYFNKPILCSGANLAYEKQVFADVGGYEGADQTATGDDIFLMMKVQKIFPGTIHYLKSIQACVYTHPESFLNAAIQQRKRWAAKSFSYGFSYITCIAVLVFFANLFCLFSGVLSITNMKFISVFLLCFSTKCVIDLMLLASASVFFEKKLHVFLFLIASVIYPFYVFVTGVISSLTHYSWKGRRS